MAARKISVHAMKCTAWAVTLVACVRRAAALTSIVAIGASVYWPSSAQGQSYEYVDPTPIFLRQIGPWPPPPPQWFLDWDAACVAGLGGYGDPWGGYHPTFGPGCFYHHQGQVVFGQNWVLPRLACPLGGWGYVASLNLCRRATTYDNSSVCPTGNPVDPADGSKRQAETDIESIVGGTRIGLVRVLFTESLSSLFASEFGYGWTADPWRRSVQFIPNSTSPQDIRLSRRGRIRALVNTGPGVWRTNPYDGTELKDTPGGWLLVDQTEAGLELYDGDGRLVVLQKSNGLAFNLIQSAGLLQSVSSSLGPLFNLSYTAGKVAALTGSGDRRVNYTFDALSPELLRIVTYPDDKTRSYLYDPTPIPGDAALIAQLTIAAYLPQSLYTGPSPHLAVAQRIANRASLLPVIGIIDELGNRFATYQYDSLGRATRTERADGAQRYQFSYPAIQTQTIVTDPLGTQRTYNFAKIAQTLKQTSQSQPAGSGCDASSSAITYDAQGNATSRTDFDAKKICYAHDLSRNLETKRVEGVASGAYCPSAISSPPAGSRVISTEWHPDWQLQTRVAEPKQITTIAYNGHGASCTSASALINEKPVAVICSRREQATTDETGATGFTATLVGAPRIWSYTYTTYGRMLTATDPNSRTTSYTYYADDDPDLGRRGNIASITNAANHVTQITDYNPHGQPTRIADANGVVTVLTYDPRMRLRSRTVSTEATSFDYDPRGLLEVATLPDGASLTYGYDNAHRLTSIADHKGNRVDYTLDPMGNRTEEQLRDPGGALVKNIARVIDALNRVQQVTGSVQ